MAKKNGRNYLLYLKILRIVLICKKRLAIICNRCTRGHLSPLFLAINQSMPEYSDFGTNIDIQDSLN